MYEVIESEIYNIIENYICIDYLSLLQVKLSKHDKNFENTKFNNLSGLVIPEILMNIMSCCVFINLQYPQ